MAGNPLDELSLFAASDVDAPSRFYLVSSKWFSAWQEWTSSPTSKPRPGEIDNSVLLKSTIKNELSPTVKPSDYQIISEDQWNLLVAWYGGGPTIRREKIYQYRADDLVVSLYPMKLNLVRSGALTADQTWTAKDLFVELYIKSPGSSPLQSCIHVTNHITGQTRVVQRAQGLKTLRDLAIEDGDTVALAHVRDEPVDVDPKSLNRSGDSLRSSGTQSLRNSNPTNPNPNPNASAAIGPPAGGMGGGAMMGMMGMLGGGGGHRMAQHHHHHHGAHPGHGGAHPVRRDALIDDDDDDMSRSPSGGMGGFPGMPFMGGGMGMGGARDSASTRRAELMGSGVLPPSMAAMMNPRGMAGGGGDMMMGRHPAMMGGGLGARVHGMQPEEDEEMKRALALSLQDFEAEKKKKEAEKQQEEIKKNFESAKPTLTASAASNDDDDDYLLSQHEAEQPQDDDD